MPCIPLSSTKPNQLGHIVGVRLPPKQKLYLEELGFLEGTPIQLVRFSPLKDLLYLNFRGTKIALQKELADCISVSV